MTKDELKVKIDKCFENSEQIMLERGELIPMLDIEFIDDTGEKQIMAVVLATGKDRNVRDKFIQGLGGTLGLVKRMGKIKGVECVVMMSEAWFSSPSKEQYEKGNYYKMPSQDPHKREMLMATGLTNDGICLMHGKEMFSVEVKGKRHFTLSDIPEMKKGFESMESNVLNNFFVGYKNATENSKKNELFDVMFSKFGDMPLDEILQRSIKILTQQVGGLNSEFINPNKQ